MAHTMPVARRRVGLDAIVVAGDSHKYALKKVTYTPGQTDYSAADGQECTATNYPAGGVAVTGIVNANGATKSFSDIADPAFTDLTGQFGWGVWYRVADNKVVLEQDLGAQDVTNLNVTITQPAAAEGTALLQV